MKKILLTAMSLATIGSIAPIASCGCTKSACTLSLFCNEGGTLEGGQTTFTVSQGTKWKDIANKPTPTPKSGYKFIGWYRNDTKIEDETAISNNMDIYAWFEKEAGEQCYVTVLAGPGGSINGASVFAIQSGTKWGNIKPATEDIVPDTKYHFVGWWMDDEQINDDTIISKNSYIFAWFENDDTTKCAIKFVSMAGGSFGTGATTVYTVNKNSTWSSIKSKAPVTYTKTGYKFENWYIDNVVPTDETPITDTTYCFAYFEKTTVKITIDSSIEHGSIVEQPGNVGVGLFNNLRTTLDKCVRPEDGYVLAGWFDTDGKRIFDNYKIETDKTIKPLFIVECNEYQFKDEEHTAAVYKRKTGVADLMIPAYIWKTGDNTPYKVNAISYQDGTGYYDGCDTLKTVCIPNTISTIADRAFRNCKNLTTVYIPTSITWFCYHSFYFSGYNSSLTSFNYLGLKSDYIKITKSAYWTDGMKTKTCMCLDGGININP